MELEKRKAENAIEVVVVGYKVKKKKLGNNGPESRSGFTRCFCCTDWLVRYWRRSSSASASVMDNMDIDSSFDTNTLKPPDQILRVLLFFSFHSFLNSFCGGLLFLINRTNLYSCQRIEIKFLMLCILEC